MLYSNIIKAFPVMVDAALDIEDANGRNWMQLLNVRFTPNAKDILQMTGYTWLGGGGANLLCVHSYTQSKLYIGYRGNSIYTAAGSIVLCTHLGRRYKISGAWPWTTMRLTWRRRCPSACWNPFLFSAAVGYSFWLVYYSWNRLLKIDPHFYSPQNVIEI